MDKGLLFILIEKIILKLYIVEESPQRK